MKCRWINDEGKRSLWSENGHTCYATILAEAEGRTLAMVWVENFLPEWFLAQLIEQDEGKEPEDQLLDYTEEGSAVLLLTACCDEAEVAAQMKNLFGLAVEVLR